MSLPPRTMGQWLGSTATHDNKQVLAYSSGTGNQILLPPRATDGHRTRAHQCNLASSIEVHVDSQTSLTLSTDTTQRVNLNWRLVGLAGRSALGDEVKRFQRSTRCCAFKRFIGRRFGLSNGTGTNLAVWIYDGTVPPQRHKPHRPQQRNQPRHVNQRLAAPRCADDQWRPPCSNNGLEARTGLNTPSHNQRHGG